MKKIFALLVVAVLFVACGDESSSSAPATDPSEESSSSVEKSSESSSSTATKKSSSSVSDDKSSSSVKEENSSSSVVKSSSSDDAPKSSSSEESKNSSAASSSSAKSSSSFDINAPCPEGDFKRYQGVVYECVDGLWTKYEYSSSSSAPKSSSSRGYEALPYDPFNSSLNYGEFTDSRDGTKYATIDIDNKYGPDSVHLAFTVFAQNLKYHEKMVAGTEEQEDDTKVEMYCYNDSIEYCNDWWGGLYQWAEMMALPYECNSKNCADLIDPDGDGFHQGICPNGWHLMSERELLAASYASGVGKSNIERANTMKSEISFSLAGGENLTGMSLIATGYRLNEMKGKNLVVFDRLYEATSYDFPAEYEAVDAATCRGGAVYSENAYLTWGNQKRYGASVRCVKDY